MQPARARWLMLLTALLPVIATNLCYAVSASQELIPTCITYLHGCTSISASGRYGVAYFLFKATMLPQALLLFLFWGLLARTLGSGDTMRRCGQTGAAFLVIYVIFLGADNDIYRLMRRYGVFVYFIGTFVAMVIATRIAWRQQPRRRSAHVLAGLCGAMLVLGLLEAPLGTFGLADNQSENLIEWNFALLMQLWFLAFWYRLRRTPIPVAPD